MLRLTGISAGYAGGTVLHEVTVTVAAGTVHGILGHNGAGKTTLVNTVVGLVRPDGGTIHLDGKDITGQPVHRVARAGVRLVPQGRRVFAGLTVAEHFRVAYRPVRGQTALWTPHRLRDLLPRLGERWGHRGAQLSGGEQQMLAIARALLGQPRLLVLDEPTEGLAPVIVTQILDMIGLLAREGLTVLLTGPQPQLVTGVADHLTVLRTGRVAAQSTGQAARDDPGALLRSLTLGTTPAHESRRESGIVDQVRLQ